MVAKPLDKHELASLYVKCMITPKAILLGENTKYFATQYGSPFPITIILGSWTFTSELKFDEERSLPTVNQPDRIL